MNVPTRRQSQQDTSEISQVSVTENQRNTGQLQVPVESGEPQQDTNASARSQLQQGQRGTKQPLFEENNMTHICTRCGYGGHTKYYCRESVYCNLCN